MTTALALPTQQHTTSNTTPTTLTTSLLHKPITLAQPIHSCQTQTQGRTTISRQEKLAPFLANYSLPHRIPYHLTTLVLTKPVIHPSTLNKTTTKELYVPNPNHTTLTLHNLLLPSIHHSLG